MIQSRLATLSLLFLAGASLAALPLSCGGGEQPDTGYKPVTGSGGGGGAGGEGGTSASSGSGGAGGEGGGMGGAGGAGGMGGAGGAGGAGGEACIDTGISEPNEAEGSATDLGDLTDCDGDSAGMTSGVLVTEADVDWFKYTGTDGTGCDVDPSRSIAATGPVELCKFVECVSGTASFSCPSGSTAATSPMGHPGCCSSKGFLLQPDCDGIDDDATVYVRIKGTDATPCIQYALTFHY
jgi:hypothetical protein